MSRFWVEVAERVFESSDPVLGVDDGGLELSRLGLETGGRIVIVDPEVTIVDGPGIIGEVAVSDPVVSLMELDAG